MPSASSRTTTDHDEIRQWAEERGGRPSCVRNTGGDGDIGILRIDFPGYSGQGSLEEISWDNWFDKFNERGLALLYQESTAGGQRSNFNKLVSRETAKQTQTGHRGTSRRAQTTSRSRRPAATGRSSRSSKSTRSRNQNRSEGRSSRRKTTARAGESRGRSSSRAASSRRSSTRGKRSSARSGRAGETGTRMSRASSTRRGSSGMHTSKTRSAQAKSRANTKSKSSRSNLRRAA